MNDLLPMPKNFDENEWIIIISFLLLIILLLFLPKRFPTSITILIIAFSMAIARLVDHLLAGPNTNLYDVLDSGKFEFFDLMSYVPYSPFAYIFIYLYDYWKIKGINIALYIIFFSLFGVGIEWVTTKFFDLFTFYRWHHIYSFPIYLIVQSLTLLFFHFIIKNYKLTNSKKESIH